MKKIVWSLIFLLFMGCSKILEAQACYGCKASYAMGKLIRFPDFDLEFSGVKEQNISVNGKPVSFGPCYNFKVSSKGQSKMICWSSGTGDIAPIPFKVVEACFTLARLYSEKIPKITGKFQNLAENELVIDKVPLNWCQNIQ